MHTPSLTRRVVATGVGVVAVLALGLDVLLYLSVRSVASDRTAAALDSQAALVNAVAPTTGPFPSAEDFARRLGMIGIEATVKTGARVFESGASGTEGSGRRVSREIPAGPNLRVVVYARSPDDDPRVRRLLAFEAVATPLAVVLAALLLRWIAEVATAPLEKIAAAARRTTSGHEGERLRPDRPDTRLGQMAATYDAMLDALEGAVAEAKRSEARTRTFLDDAAHQLRTPITSIRASAETLQRKVTPAQRDQLLAAVVRDSERAGRLMAGLLRIARLENTSALDTRPLDLLALCQEMAAHAGDESPSLKISARRGDERAPTVAEVDADAVTEILANLVDNARRHARSCIEMIVGGHGDWVTVRVTNDGPGLARDQHGSVFDRFVSLDGKGGAGLGLSIARTLARGHGGDLTYEPGGFVLTLPASAPSGLPQV